MKRFAFPLVLAALIAAPAAHAHISVHPNVIPAGQFAQVVVRVPSERSDADTTRVDVRLPSGFIFVSYEPVPGWSTRITYRKLAQPVTAFGESHDQEVDRVTWTGGKIGAGQFVDFPLSVAMPDATPGTLLTFKALQTYSDGDVVRWIGSPSSENPAPQVALAGEDAPAQDVLAGPRTTAAPTPAGDDDDEGDDVTEYLALGLGALGAAAGVVALALVLVRRRAA